MKAIGADVSFNYKTTSTEEVLAKEGPIDVYVSCAQDRPLSHSERDRCRYWDNVGGETLEHALTAANVGGRFIVSQSVLCFALFANLLVVLYTGMRNDFR